MRIGNELSRMHTQQLEQFLSTRHPLVHQVKSGTDNRIQNDRVNAYVYV